MIYMMLSVTRIVYAAATALIERYLGGFRELRQLSGKHRRGR
jgi:hypothetical protein